MKVSCHGNQHPQLLYLGVRIVWVFSIWEYIYSGFNEYQPMLLLLGKQAHVILDQGRDLTSKFPYLDTVNRDLSAKGPCCSLFRAFDAF